MGLEDTTRFIIKAFDGDDGAWNKLLERLRPRLVLWVATRLSPTLRAKEDPEDVAQEILMAVQKGRNGFARGDPKGFLAWVFKVAENRIRDLADYHGAQKRQPLDAPRAFDQTSPSARAARHEQRDRLAHAMTLLTDDHRRVIQLLRIEELPVPEVAMILDRSENAVRILYCRSLKELRQVMESEGGGAPGGSGGGNTPPPFPLTGAL